MVYDPLFPPEIFFGKEGLICLQPESDLNEEKKSENHIRYILFDGTIDLRIILNEG